MRLVTARTFMTRTSRARGGPYESVGGFLCLAQLWVSTVRGLQQDESCKENNGDDADIGEIRIGASQSGQSYENKENSNKKAEKAPGWQSTTRSDHSFENAVRLLELGLFQIV